MVSGNDAGDHGHENPAYIISSDSPNGKGAPAKYLSTDASQTMDHDTDANQTMDHDSSGMDQEYPTKKSAIGPVTISQQDLLSSTKELDEDDLPCKWGSLWCCQPLRDPKMVLFLLCCSSCVQGMVVNGFVSVIVSSLEKRFDLKSADTGLIASSYDIASLLSLIPVTYFGGLGSKPRWLGFGIIFMGLGSFVMSLPHYTTDLYVYDTSGDTSVCDVTRNTSSSMCTTQSTLYNYKYVLILGQLMHGVGAAPLYTLGVTYLDENLKQKMSSIYVGIFYAMSIAGPAIGYILGGYLLTYYTDFDKVSADLITITEDSVSWVGAWWLGFLLGGGLAIIIGTLLLGFPKYLPNTAKIRAEKISEVYGGAQAINTTDSGISSLKDLPKYVKLILSNPTFIFLSLGGATEAMVVSGFTTFMPKYLESQFSVSPSMAALIVGGATVPAGGGGTFIGGYLVKRLNLKVAGTIKMCLLTCVVVLVAILALLIKCEDITFAGVTSNYLNSSSVTETNLRSDCNSDCGCQFSYYNPVCGANNVMYFSSCTAGCLNHTTIGGVKTFTNCSCIAADPMTPVSQPATAVDGRCSADCNLLPVFMVVFVVVILFTFITIMPGLSATLRSVPDKQRSFALGIQWIIIRSLGSIPGPVTFGAVIDQTCLFWLNPCGKSEDGACYFYNNTTLSNYMLALAMGCKALSTIFYCLAWLLYKAPPTENNNNGNHASNGGYSNPGVNPSDSTVIQTSDQTVSDQTVSGHDSIAVPSDLTSNTNL